MNDIVVLHEKGTEHLRFAFVEATRKVHVVSRNGKCNVIECNAATFKNAFKTASLYRHLFHLGYHKHEIYNLLDLPYYVKMEKFLKTPFGTLIAKAKASNIQRSKEFLRILNLV